MIEIHEDVWINENTISHVYLTTKNSLKCYEIYLTHKDTSHLIYESEKSFERMKKFLEA